MTWFENKFFYFLELTKGNVVWVTDFPFETAKDVIRTESFILIEEFSRYLPDKMEAVEVNTKAIVTIKDITMEKRKEYALDEAEFQHKLLIINEIRKYKLPFFINLELKQDTKNALNWHSDYYLNNIGFYQDSLMLYGLEYLQKLLLKVKKKNKKLVI